MKELLLIRHAKSSWENPLLSDFNRPLNERGNNDAPKMADWLKSKIKIDQLLASTAVRAKSTADIFINKLKLKPDQYSFNKKLYHASASELMQFILATDDSVNSLLLVAHNPGLNDLANYLIPDFKENIPTCGIFWLRIKTDSWLMTKSENSKLVSFRYPKSII